MESSRNPSARELSTPDLLKQVASDMQSLAAKETALAKAESALAIKAEVAAALGVIIGLSLAILGLTMALTAILVGMFGWKVTAIVGTVILAISLVPAYIGYKKHNGNPIPQTRNVLREEAQWIRKTFSKLHERKM